MANLGRHGGLLPILQPFAALYVLILAISGAIAHYAIAVRVRTTQQNLPLAKASRDEGRPSTRGWLTLAS